MAFPCPPLWSPPLTCRWPMWVYIRINVLCIHYGNVSILNNTIWPHKFIYSWLSDMLRVIDHQQHSDWKYCRSIRPMETFICNFHCLNILTVSLLLLFLIMPCFCSCTDLLGILGTESEVVAIILRTTISSVCVSFYLLKTSLNLSFPPFPWQLRNSYQVYSVYLRWLSLHAHFWP